jgi:hypothetical protein
MVNLRNRAEIDFGSLSQGRFFLFNGGIYLTVEKFNDDGWTNWSLPIGNGYFGERFFRNKLFERILHYIFCDVWHFAASVLALRAGCSDFLIL